MKIGSKKILPGGKSGRSKYRQIAMLSAMATACTTCHGRDTIKVKCLQHLNRNIWNTNKINCLSFKTFVLLSFFPYLVFVDRKGGGISIKYFSQWIQIFMEEADEMGVTTFVTESEVCQTKSPPCCCTWKTIGSS